MSNPRIQLRHDTASNWSTANPVLLDGEIGIEKGVATVMGFDDSSTGSYTLNGTVLTNPTPELEYNMGITALEANKEVVIYLRLKLPTTATEEYQDLVRLGDYSASNDVFFTRLTYRGGSWGTQLGLCANGRFEVQEGSIPSNGVDTWIDLKFTFTYDGNNTIYTYTGIKLASDDNYNTLNNNNVSASSIGSTNKPTCFFYANQCEIDMAHCTMDYNNSNIWTGMVEGSPTKLKVGDGVTAWNNLDYLI